MVATAKPYAVKNRLLVALPHEEYKRLQPHLEFVQLSKHRTLYEAGDLIQHAYFLNSGMGSLLGLTQGGASVEIDGAGNIFATRRGRDDGAALVLTGSHIDTQPSGGKFDGNYGVLAGLEVLRTLNDAGVVTDKPLGVAIWTNEEGSRFVPVMGGSGAFAGVYTLEHLRQQRDIEGIAFGDALEAIGYSGDAPVGGRALDAYFEAHIEQGPVLEREEKVIGVVTCAGTTASGRGRMRTPVRRRWKLAAMRCAALRRWSKRSTRSRCVTRPMAERRWGSCRSAPIRATWSPVTSR